MTNTGPTAPAHTAQRHEALLTDGSIKLRQWRQTDIPAIVAACRDPELPRWIPEVPEEYTEADAHAWLERQALARDLASGTAFAVVDKDSDEVMGCVAIHSIDHMHRSAEIGYWTVARARGCGIATRAVQILCRWAFEELELERLHLTADPDNGASLRVAEGCGFEKEGRLRSHLRTTRGRRDSLLYSLLRQDGMPL